MSDHARLFATVAVLVLAAGCAPGVPPTTDTPGDPLAGVTDAQRGRFLLGRALFERLATPEEGLGPLFNATRCSDCHAEPVSGGGGSRVLVHKATRFAEGRCSLLASEGGDNIEQRATPRLIALGMGPEAVPADATADIFVASPPLFGLGLVEAVPDAELERLADPDDRDGDGISGRLAHLPDGRAARFGRKGDVASVRAFIETALIFELGFTNDAYPEEATRNGTPIPAAADPMPDPEMDAATVGLITDYVRLLAAPAPETPSNKAVADSIQKGRAAFEGAGCTSCHTPTLETGDAPEAVLSHRKIALYSDLLLHDLGGADGDVCTPQAAPGEYRTAPLWGLRLRTRYLHDASAGTLEEAIRAHGGESTSARKAYEALDAVRQALLLRFLGSL